MNARLAMATGLLIGCGPSDAEVASLMDAGLREAHLALAAALLAHELTTHAHEAPDTQLRHGTADCGCPCTERTGEPPSTFLLALDYHEAACVPESGLIPAVISGRAVLTVTGDRVESTPDALRLGYDLTVGGQLEGEVRASTLEALLGGELRLGDRAHLLDLRVEPSGDALLLEGSVDASASGGAGVSLEAVILPRERIALPCPTPTGGRAEVTLEGGDRIGVDFEDPGDGRVTASLRDRISDPAPWCAFDDGLW